MLEGLHVSWSDEFKPLITRIYFLQIDLDNLNFRNEEKEHFLKIKPHKTPIQPHRP